MQEGSAPNSDHPTAQEIMSEVRTRFQELGIKVALPTMLSLAAGGVALGTHFVLKDGEHDVRISKIEETRFTAEEGIKMESRLKEYMSDHYPPPWLRERLDDIKKTVESNAARLRELERAND